MVLPGELETPSQDDRACRSIHPVAMKHLRVLVPLAALLFVGGVAGLTGVVASAFGPPTAGTLAYGNRSSLAAFLRQEDTYTKQTGEVVAIAYLDIFRFVAAGKENHT